MNRKKKFFRRKRGFVPNPAEFWGYSVKNGKIGYSEMRRQLPSELFRRMKKKRPLFVYEWVDQDTGFRMEVETALNPKNGLLYLGFGNPVFIVRHYDLKMDVAGAASDVPPSDETDAEVLEWRKYIDEDSSFLLALGREVGCAFRLHEMRPECCGIPAVYARLQGFQCQTCQRLYPVPAAYDFSEKGETRTAAAV